MTIHGVQHVSLLIQRKPIVYTAVQWTGPADLPAVQAFVAPMSPSYGRSSGDNWTLLVSVRDEEAERKWPGLGIQYKPTPVAVGDYIVKDQAGELRVISQTQLEADFDVVPGMTSTAAIDTVGRDIVIGWASIGATHPRALSEQQLREARGMANAITHEGRQPDDTDAD